MIPDQQERPITGLLSPSVGMVPGHALDQVWPQVSEILQTKGKKWLQVVDEQDIYRLILSGQAQLWCGMHNAEIECVMICMTETHARASYYHVCFIGGKNLRKYLLIGMEKVEHYAAISGATEIVLEGRLGFKKLLQPYGYGTNTIRLRKPVSVLWRN